MFIKKFVKCSEISEENVTEVNFVIILLNA